MFVTATVALCHYGNAVALFRAWGKAIWKNDDGFREEEENECVEFPSVNPGEGMCSAVSCFYSSLGIVSCIYKQAGLASSKPPQNLHYVPSLYVLLKICRKYEKLF